MCGAQPGLETELIQGAVADLPQGDPAFGRLSLSSLKCFTGVKMLPVMAGVDWY